MEFSEFIKLDKDNLTDRMFKYATLVDSLIHIKLDLEEELAIEVLKLESIEFDARVITRQKKKHLTQKSTETEIKDSVGCKTEVKEIKKEIIYMTSELNEVKARLGILKDVKDIMLSLNNDKREEKRSGRLLGHNGGNL